MTKNEYTVLSDRSAGGEASHREVAEQLIPELKEEMPEEEFQIDFLGDLHQAVIESILRDLSANLSGEDWRGMGFDDPADFLNAESVSNTIGEMAQWYFEDDQTGKSWDILIVVLEYAGEYDLVERGG